MYRICLFFFVFGCACFSAMAQSVDSTALKVDSVIVAVDSVMQDIKKETRQERRTREKEEKERAKFYYKDILKDSTRLAIEHVSRVAWKRSLILPGWGQYTNGGLWWIKVPIIYGGFAGAYFTFDYWQWYYRKFLDEAQYRIDNNNAVNDPDLIGLSLDGIIRIKDNTRRNRDLTILATAGLWGLNVVEAYVTSMLKNRYDMGDDLSLKVSPTFMPSGYLGYQSPLKSQFVPGIKLTFNIR
ncbi:DUF5683 domain-containing protein [Sphingobacterium lumbrici]|uniref:DUF5683 domain-containing protein n=1 Tax=Sphingobacterium lumbrici TaxID=2559600 RepID=UPI00112C092A|nr:DUF5683 domain-containing protein [Sphingobacterium lumbrici]